MNLDRFSHGRDPQEKEPKTLGKCPGCGDDIENGEEVIEYDGNTIHNDSTCCRRYLRNVGIEKIAG